MHDMMGNALSVTIFVNDAIRKFLLAVICQKVLRLRNFEFTSSILFQDNVTLKASHTLNELGKFSLSESNYFS